MRDLLAIAIIALAIKDHNARNNPPPIIVTEDMGKFNAKCLPPFGIYVSKEQANNERLLEHELVHWNQYLQRGLVGYYADYAGQYLQYGYDQMPMEKEARFRENPFAREYYTYAVRNGLAETVYDPNFRI